MANSKYEYTRAFEQPDPILRNTWIVVRVDGRGFHRFSASRGFEKPNDARALHLMNRAAEGVLRDVQDVVVGYGQSDEYSNLFERRASKLVSTVVSTFTAYYNLYWAAYFPRQPMFGPKVAEPTNSADHTSASDLSPADSFTTLGPVPTFDGRAVAYPSVSNLRDYLSWRQADCWFRRLFVAFHQADEQAGHINNLYNTTFWTLVQRGGLSGHEAEQRLQGTVSGDKNEILFAEFGINYNNEPQMYRKGSIIFRDYSDFVKADDAGGIQSAKKPPDAKSKSQRERDKKRRAKARIVVEHTDIIEDTFWSARPWLLGQSE